MRLPFSWVPEAPWCNESAQVVVLEVNQTHVQPFLSVQYTLNRCRGIIRGLKDAQGNLIEDHVDELLDGQGSLRRLPSEVRLVGAGPVRTDVWTAAEHCRRYESLYPQRKVVAWTGVGNTLANPYYVSLRRKGASLQLYRVAAEDKSLRSRTYTCFMRWKGTVQIVPLRFTLHPLTAIDAASGKNVSADIEFATAGPQLVHDGKAVNEKDVAEMVLDGQFYDLRHVFLFGRVHQGEERWLDAGLACLWDGAENLVRDALTVALEKTRPVRVQTRQFNLQEVREGLAGKGYREVNRGTDPQRPGEYRIDEGGGELELLFLPGIYPQHVVGIREDGTVLDVLIRGLSNRVGMTLYDTAQTLVDLGVWNAVLLDAGGDVMLNVLGEPVVESSEGKRDRLRGLLLWTAPKEEAKRLPSDALRVIHYPKQWRPT